MPDGRRWQVVSDGSLNGGAEVVTPILQTSDLETLLKVVRELRHHGANRKGELEWRRGAERQFTISEIRTTSPILGTQEGLVRRAKLG